jgi:hypothetical protein
MKTRIMNVGPGPALDPAPGPQVAVGLKPAPGLQVPVGLTPVQKSLLETTAAFEEVLNCSSELLIKLPIVVMISVFCASYLPFGLRNAVGVLICIATTVKFYYLYTITLRGKVGDLAAKYSEYLTLEENHANRAALRDRFTFIIVRFDENMNNTVSVFLLVCYQARPL